VKLAVRCVCFIKHRSHRSAASLPSASHATACASPVSAETDSFCHSLSFSCISIFFHSECIVRGRSWAMASCFKEDEESCTYLPPMCMTSLIRCVCLFIPHSSVYATCCEIRDNVFLSSCGVKMDGVCSCDTGYLGGVVGRTQHWSLRSPAQFLGR
jgi:hypothetical protein